MAHPDISKIQPAEMKMEILPNAYDANTKEHEMKFREALSIYSKGVIWSLLMTTAIIMEGYDTKLMGTFFAFPAFQKAYGVHVKADKYQIPAPWQAGLSNGSAMGQLLGIAVSGYISERFGFRMTMLAGQLTITAFICILFFATSLPILEVGQILFGIPLGLFQTTIVALGQILAIGILRGLLNRTDQWAYRIPFAIQWVWPALLIPLTFMAPESPWWLVRRNQLQKAKDVMLRLTRSRDEDFDVDKAVALMVVTTEHEREVEAGTSYWTCFQGINLRRTLTVIGIYCVQVLNGNSLRGYSTYFFQQAGLPTTQSFNMSIVVFAIAIVAGFGSWALLPLLGRRTVYLSGLVVLAMIMGLVGGLGIPQAITKDAAYSWGIGSLIVISSFVYYGTIGPLTNTLCAEIPSALLRSKSVALARFCYIILSTVANVLTPYQLNETAWNWGAKTGFFWCGGCLISLTFAYFLVPETRDRTTKELDHLYETRIPARKFAATAVDFAEGVQMKSQSEPGLRSSAA